MLTATYSLVAMSAEQDKTRSRLSRLQQYLQSSWKGLQAIDFSFLETAFSKLLQCEKYFRTRKLERYLIPALRGAGREAEMLVAELDALSAKGMSYLRAVGDQLSGAAGSGTLKVGELCHAMQRYCDCLAVRIEREERELIPLARRVLSVEEWFAVAAQFLADDGASDGRHAARARAAGFGARHPTIINR
ncbi:MAG TPA: hypothetical protein VEC01_07505 [Noviherbaspirillum sp.]|uniref:hypothetical protein n=1 Tax=Noviherbaspirillum sp. TaxID=1926288 RepID=UPI002D2EEA3C|nr:hypothetical protein [Noviherbaspirillum sp.]HYD95154.1 hypothetical protein [Noviherbaspirillum sp.]